MKPKILSWNVRGLNEGQKRLRVRNLLQDWKVDIVCFQETKLHSLSRRLVRSLWRCNYVDWVCLDSSGASGGILILWDKRVVEKIEKCIGVYSLAVKFKNIEDDSIWAFAGVYGPNLASDRRLLWEELAGVMSWWNLPWCIGGDFNVTRFPSERSGVACRLAMSDFSEFLHDQGLLDLPLAGGFFTWSISQDPPKWSRIDRFLISHEWEARFPGVSQKRLPRFCSDHFPLLLECVNGSRGKRPFRFENMWLKNEGFGVLVKQWWDSYHFQGSPSFVFACKIKALKLDLKRWNEETFGNMDSNKSKLLNDLQGFDAIEEFRALGSEELAMKAEVSRELDSCLLMEEVSWRQKSRILWLKEGDKCTKYFHSMANSRRRYNSIDSLMINGILSTNQVEISEHIVKFYQKLFSEQCRWRIRVDDLEFDQILEQEAGWLEREFDEAEVRKVVFAMNGDKAPGPDGFSIAFFQACWDIVKEDIMKIFSGFHTEGKFEASLNSTFISLIPKIPGASEMKDFRPISLVGGIYKIIAKVLANRLKGVLEKVISKTQSAFIEGRQILDPILIANETLDCRLRSKEPGILCKLDVEKAYDHVNWDFLLYMLKRCGFGAKWCSWISYCISSARFSVLVNGSPEGFFDSSRGLRQGDPLSPLLFVFVMEALSRMLSAGINDGLLEGFKVGNEFVSHLLFADDTLIFCNASPDQLAHLRGILLLFEAASGLKVNLAKSVMIPVGNVQQVDYLASILGCEVASLPFEYLGLPLGAPNSAIHIWDGVLEKMDRHLAGWKQPLLSKGGRVTLIKSTLANIPTYYMSLFKIPVSVANRIEKLQRDFLWGGVGDDFKYHLVKWSKVCSPISKGGLGIRKLVDFNRALLGKWLWRYGHEREAWWRVVVEAKYGSMWGGWCTYPHRGASGVSLWKNIRSGWEIFSSHSKLVVGEGNWVRFWHDRWCGDTKLKDDFPVLYNIAREKDASVATNVEFLGGAFQWNVIFGREIHDWEVEVVTSFYQRLQTVSIRMGHQDKLWWSPSKRGRFKVKDFFRALSNEEDYGFPWKSVWRTKAPPRAAFFVWSAALGKILTLDNLRKRQVIVVNRCYMCKKEGESVDHLLLHCEVAHALWCNIFSRLGLSWVMPSCVSELCACWCSSGRTRSAVVWKMVPICIFWTLWRERNNRCFEDVESSMEAIIASFLYSLYLWTAAYLSPRSICYAGFLSRFSFSS
jgi:hypothetical protein